MIVDHLKLLAEIKAEADAARRQGRQSVIVGYSTGYALYVHEMTPKNKGKPRRSGIGRYWGPSFYGNQFLLGPARKLASMVASIVKDSYSKSGDLLASLALGGVRIQRESMAAVPKEHGTLRQSAFTEKE